MKRITIIASIVIAIAITGAWATIINVPDDYPSIQEGIDVSVNGDTVLVQPEIYVENINFNGRNIVLGSLFLTIGDATYISSTIIDGDSSGTVVTFENGEDSLAIVSGFTIQNGFNINGGGISCSYSNPAINSNTIRDNTASNLGGGIMCINSNPTINGNTINDNSASNLGGGILCFYSNPTMSNNTISGNSAEYYGGGIYCSASDPTISNTIFWANSAQYSPEIYIYSGSPVIIYCDVQSGWEGEGNIDCDPMFCDPETDNFYLAENSCCVGAGDNGEDIGALGVGCEPTVVDEDQPLPSEFSFPQNYPNPFNARTVIEYTLSEASSVTIEIYDLLGRKVETLVESRRSPGYYRINWDASDIPSGIYFAKLTTKQETAMIKTILAK